MCSIYSINYDGIVLYIGSTSRKVSTRWQEHKRELQKGAHSNKALQKYFNKNELSIEDLEFKLLYKKNTEDKLVKFTLELFTISLTQPLQSGCVIKSNRTVVRFKKVEDKELCKRIIESIME